VGKLCFLHHLVYNYYHYVCVCCLSFSLMSVTTNRQNISRLWIKEERNILHTIQRTKANWIGHILRRNRLLQHIIEVKLQQMLAVTGGRGIRRKQLLDDLKAKKAYSKLKEEALDCTVENSLWERLWTCKTTK